MSVEYELLSRLGLPTIRSSSPVNNQSTNAPVAMTKFMLLAICVLLASTLVSAASKDKCGRHGDPCVSKSDCCPHKQMACNRFAQRCQIQITEAELWAQREKILGRRGPDQ